MRSNGRRQDSVRDVAQNEGKAGGLPTDQGRAGNPQSGWIERVAALPLAR